MEYILIFDSTAHAIRAESLLNDAKVKLKVRAMPNEISAGCGISIFFEDIDSVNKVILDNKIEFKSIYSLSDGKYEIISK